MAIKKQIVLGSGIVTLHHRILSAQIDWKERRLRVMVGHYVDATARIEGKEPVEEERHNAFFSEFPLSDGGAVQNELYTWLKTLPQYENAEDEIIESEV